MTWKYFPKRKYADGFTYFITQGGNRATGHFVCYQSGGEDLFVTSLVTYGVWVCLPGTAAGTVRSRAVTVARPMSMGV